MAREAGYRSKIAVESRVQGVDPVGACVGPRGSRVRMVVSELRGEKIDIIPWNDEPARFVAKALAPARVREVLVDDEDEQATVVVPDDQLSLAIGREGQNARLAAKLTGWRIDIKSETEFAEEEAEIAFSGTDEDDEVGGRCAALLSSGKRCPNTAAARLALLRHPGPPRARDGRGRLDRIAPGPSEPRPPGRGPRRRSGAHLRRLRPAQGRSASSCGCSSPSASCGSVAGDGRGAYVCVRESCVEKARRSRLLARSLRARPPIPDDLWSRVRLVSENTPVARIISSYAQEACRRHRP